MTSQFDPSSSRPASLRDVFDRLLRPGAASTALDEAPCFDEGEAGEGGAGASLVLRRVLPDIYFVNTPESRSRRHMELLGRLHAGEEPSGNPILDFHEAPGLPLTECTLCAFDESRPGLLAKLSGTMAALNLSVHTAFIYTLRLRAISGELLEASDAEGRAVALNTFLLSETYSGHDRALTARTQKKLKIELCRVLRGEVRIEDLLSRARRPLPPLRILELRVENRAHEAQTRILLRAEDSFGVLYRATSALANMNLGVSTAQVSTRDEEADDLFFVSAPGGGKVTDEDLPALQARLRVMLQGGT